MVIVTGRSSRRSYLTPARVVVLAFVGAIAVGTALLALPVSHEPGASVGLLAALFTATSAVCVTGLTVVDTGETFSRFGEAVIMLLIKSGGIGILSLGVLLAFATGRRIGFRERLQLREQSNRLDIGGAVRFVRDLVLYTTAVELLGAGVLYLRFQQVEGAGGGVFYALFHSVSAFNNAGFALYPDNLARFVGDPLVSLTIAALIILGGLGVVVAFEAGSHLRRRRREPLSLHSRVSLVTTLVLILAATAFVLAAEWSNPSSLGALPPGARVLAGFFQAVTPRTAGFNTIDLAGMHAGTLLFVMLLMFIGGNPGSTAGGVKTTTIAVLVTSVWAVARGHGRPTLFMRRVDRELITKAAVIVTLGGLACGGAATLLMFTEPGREPLAVLFETVSAFGTVGLSLGVTPELSEVGRVVIVVLMFLGRVGIVTFAVALAARQVDEHARYPREPLMVG